MSSRRLFWPPAASQVPDRLDPAEKLAQELTEEDRKLVDWMTEQVVERRLTAAAIFLLESCKPLNFVSSQLLLVLAPILGVFVSKVGYDRLVKLLEKRPFIELLLRSMEEREEEFLSQQRAKKEEAKSSSEPDTSTD
ncbi:MAG: hypothetical protein ACOCVR_03290 [Myxococcota bacterium]